MIASSYLCLTILGGLLAIGLSINSNKKAGLLSSYNIVLGLLTVYFFFPALLLLLLNNGNYVWAPEYGLFDITLALLACILATIAFISGYITRKGKRKRLADHPPIHNTRNGTLLSTLIVLGIFLKLYVAFASGCIEINITRFSGGIRQNLGIDSLNSTLAALRNLSGMADAAATWLLIEKLQQRRGVILATSLFLFVIGLTYLGAGKRLYLLWPALAVLLGVHHYVKNIRLASLPIIAASVLSFGFLSLMYRVYAPASIIGLEIDLNQVSWAQGSLIKFYLFSLEFSTFEVFTVALNESARIVELLGTRFEAIYTTNIVPLSYFIPRILWAEKPLSYVDMAHAYRAFLLGGPLDAGGGIAATILGTSWSLGGPLGYLTTMFGLGRLCHVIDASAPSRHRVSTTRICFYALAMVTIFHLFRQGTLAWTAIIVVMQQSGLIVGFLMLAFANSRLIKRQKAWTSVSLRAHPVHS